MGRPISFKGLTGAVLRFRGPWMDLPSRLIAMEKELLKVSKEKGKEPDGPTIPGKGNNENLQMPKRMILPTGLPIHGLTSGNIMMILKMPKINNAGVKAF